MDTIVISGTGPVIRLKLASDLRKQSETPAKVAVIDSDSVKTVTLDNPLVKLMFAA